MAGLAHNQLYSNNGSQPQLHWQKNLVEGDDDLALDDHVLDSHTTLEMAAVDHNPRRESFASTASLMSPTHQTWPEYSYNTTPASNYPVANHAAHVFTDENGNQYAHPNAPQLAQYGNQMPIWQQQNNVAPEASNPPFGTFASDLDTVKPEAPYNGEGQPSQHPNAFGGLPVQMDSEYPQYPPSAASPQWSTSSSDAVEKIPRSGQYQSALFNHNPPHLRRDGVRKKNARFEIPEGRNLQTIDELINNTNPNDEDSLKELKQQKRLLRNRQAALDSRCRKKHHTEKLEEEKKHYLAHIDRLEDDNRNYHVSTQRWMEERQQWQHYAENLIREKEELVRQHTLETAELRRKNTFLTETVDRLEDTAMSAQPSSNGVSAGFPEFEHLTVDSGTFDDFAFIDNPAMETEIRQETAAILSHRRESPSSIDSADKTAASGLLLMLLLCGAWVASRSNSNASAAVIPQMPDDVRAASTVVLDNIYKDAGLQPQTSSQSKLNKVGTAPQGASRIAKNARPAPSPLASLHHDLVTPSHQQQREQIFSLSVDQYNHITSDDAVGEHQDASNAPRKQNLGEALAAMRVQKQGPAGEVYTRSLMMDKVPADVVRDFARMMEDTRRGDSLG